MPTNAIQYTPSYTVADYELWEGDWELWNGVAVCMSPSPTPLHQFVATNIASEIRDHLKHNAHCNCMILAETDWHVDRTTIVRPDIAVICHGLPDKHIDYPPSVIVEVLSPSTEDKDRTAKRDLYEQQGVRYYLIVDPARKSVEVLELVENAYVTQSVADGIVRMNIDADCSVECVTSDFFAR